MSLRSCSITLTDPKGVRHTVDVTAESLFEAAAVALAIFKKDGWTDPVGSAARLEVKVAEPAVTHTVSVMQIQRWLQGSTPSPAERVKKDKLAKLLKTPTPR